jgi:hypothetical protein
LNSIRKAPFVVGWFSAPARWHVGSNWCLNRIPGGPETVSDPA